ncbi:hypothetical protein PVIIG_06328 [Plasmodium vivax India VII]|uniref:Variable surface protein n=1 Tax=Plasmodium vivax India VII TaxID=1077284 RepID=A0A0J9S2S0_PLAVI|nr:hypothetical protein PVIIG_06328 [Plasmodium vivax India VII]
MSILKYIHIKENLELCFFLNILTIIILMWIYHPHDDVFTYGSIIENKNKSGSSLKICFNRHLAEYEVENKLDRRELYKNSSYNFENNGIGNCDDYVSIYGSMKYRDSKKLKLYKTGYMHRYSKKKGLSKLDCYYEKKVFDAMDTINDLEKTWQGDKKSFNKKILKKYGFCFIIPSICVLPGLIIEILYILKLIHIKSSCPSGKGPHDTCQTIADTIAILNTLVFSLLSILVISGIIYVLIKIVKYERLKKGKGKMNRKEYINFCKEVFNVK